MKGKENVLSEVNIMMICYNLRRLISILSQNEMKNRLKSFALYFLLKTELFLAFLSATISFSIKTNSLKTHH